MTTRDLSAQQTFSKFRLSSALILLGLALSGCSYEDLRLYARPPDISEGDTSTINMQSLLTPIFGSVAAAVPAVGFVLTVTSGAACGALAAATATSGATGQANVTFTGAAAITGDECTADIQVVATGTVTPFSETETVSVTVHNKKDIGFARPIGVIPHQPQLGDEYCVFTIAGAPAGFTPPPGATLGPLAAGSTLCVECPSQTQAPWGFNFGTPATITLADGRIYYYVTKVGTSCTACPVGGETYSLADPC